MSQEREEGPVSLTDTGESNSSEKPEAGYDPASGPSRSLVDDIEDLVGDARTYFDAELSYQKSRAGFVAGSIKRIVIFALAGLVLALFAFGALTIGLIIALAPLVTAWGATAIVVGVLLLVVLLLLRGAASSWGEMMSVINDKEENDREENDREKNDSDESEEDLS